MILEREGISSTQNLPVERKAPADKVVVPTQNITSSQSGLFVKLSINNDQMNAVSAPVIVSSYPNYLPGSYPFMARVVSSNGALLGEYGFNDPRIILGEQGYDGPTRLDNADFQLIVPYFKEANSLQVFSGDKLMISIDISDLAKP